MKKLSMAIAAALFTVLSCFADDYVYLQQDPTPTVSYPAYSAAGNLVLSAGASTTFLSAEETYFSGVSEEWSNLSALDGTKPIGMQLIFR